MKYGNTFRSIAKTELGDEGRWQEIAVLNGLSPNAVLLVGQKLNLPAVKAQSGTVSGSGAGDQSPATLGIGRGFLFTVFEQLPDVGTGKIIRKVAVIPKEFGLTAPNPLATTSLADHALGNNASQLLSASNKPFGAPSIVGKPLLIDVAKVEAAGGKVFTVQEVVADLRRFAAQNPAAKARVEQLIWAVEKVEGEVLIEGGVPQNAIRRVSTTHTAYIRTSEELWKSFTRGELTKPQLETELRLLESSYSKARIIGRVGRVLTVVGVVLTVKEMADATQRSVDAKSYKPVAAESIRQVGGWGGALAGAKLGAIAGAAVGIETGPGLIVTGAIGAIVFGAIGYFSFDLIADWVEADVVENLTKESQLPERLKIQGVTLIIGVDENQYQFSRRALVEAGRLAGMDAGTQTAFADLFYPLNASAEAMAAYKIDWISGDPNPKDGAAMKGTEFNALRGRIFTYYLNDSQVTELERLRP